MPVSREEIQEIMARRLGPVMAELGFSCFVVIGVPMEDTPDGKIRLFHRREILHNVYDGDDEAEEDRQLLRVLLATARRLVEGNEVEEDDVKSEDVDG